MNSHAPSLFATIDVEVNDILAITEYQLAYTNTSAQNEESIFHFALPRMAALNGCKVTINGNTYIAKVKSNDQAAQDYEEALEERKRAVLIESMGDGLYAINMGNIEPQQSLSVTLYIASVIEQQGTPMQRVYRLPTTIMPRFGGTQTDIEPTYSPHARYPFKALVKGIQTGGISNASHITLESENSIEFHGLLDRDIFISWPSTQANMCYQANYEDRRYSIGYVSGKPNETDDIIPSSLHVLLDRSGSMENNAIALAKEAIAQLITKFDEQLTFNLTSFGSHHETMYLAPIELNAFNRKTLRQHIGLFQADMGGTNLFEALMHTLAITPKTEQANHLLLVTDGGVSFSAEELAAVALMCQQKRTQLHIIGIGYSVNEHLLNSLHNDTQGSYAVVNPNHELTTAIGSIALAIKYGSSPSTVKWSNSDERQWHWEPTSQYSGLAQLAYTEGYNQLIDSGDNAYSSISLTDKWAQALVSIAAVKHIQSMQRSDARAMAQSLGLLTKHTSFVMVDESNHRVDGALHTRVISHMENTDCLVSPCESYADSYLLRSNIRFCISTPISPEEEIYKELNKRWWHRRAWTKDALLKRGIDAEVITLLEEFAGLYGVSFNLFAWGYLRTYAEERSVTIPDKAKRRIDYHADKLSEECRMSLVSMFYPGEIVEQQNLISD